MNPFCPLDTSDVAGIRCSKCWFRAYGLHQEIHLLSESRSQSTLLLLEFISDILDLARTNRPRCERSFRLPLGSRTAFGKGCSFQGVLCGNTKTFKAACQPAASWKIWYPTPFRSASLNGFTRRQKSPIVSASRHLGTLGEEPRHSAQSSHPCRKARPTSPLRLGRRGALRRNTKYRLFQVQKNRLRGVR